LPSAERGKKELCGTGKRYSNTAWAAAEGGIAACMARENVKKLYQYQYVPLKINQKGGTCIEVTGSKGFSILSGKTVFSTVKKQ
jgi:hypothetical protein